MLPFIKRSASNSSKHNRLDEALTLNQFFDEHYFPHAEASKRQPHHDWSVYNTHIRRQLGHYLLTDLTNPVLDVWVREQVLSGLQRSTVNKHIHMFNRMLNLARHWTFLPLQSQHQQNIKKVPIGDYTQRFLNEEEARFRLHLDVQDQCLVFPAIPAHQSMLMIKCLIGGRISI